MANRLQDYGFVGYDGKILDTPDRIASYLSQWAQKNPGYKHVAGQDGSVAFQSPAAAPKTMSLGGTSWTYTPATGIKSGADNFAEYFFAGNPELYANPAAIPTAIQNSPETGTALMDYINASAAAGRARDSGSIFSKAFKNISTFVGAASGLNALTAGLGALAGGAGVSGAINAGTAATKALSSSLKNSFFPNGLNVFATDPLRGNAVPGIRTGVTTPAGGGAIVGTGQAAPLTGIAGGAPLGASPLAVTGGATAANIFPRFPELGQVQPLPSGVIPGTNQRIGEGPDSGFGLGDLKDIAELAGDLFGGGGGGNSSGGGDYGTLAFEGNALSPANFAMPSAIGGTGSGGPLNMLSELSRAAGDQSGISGNTRGGNYFNVLQAVRPRYAAGYT